MSIIGLQKRYRELGRLRAGEKGPKGEPRKRQTFRATTPSRELAERIAAVYGGQVVEWEGAPTQGTQWEVAIEAEELDVLVPPQDIEGSQYYELWSGGGCQRRCDGHMELLSGGPCKCDPEKRVCDMTTHLQVMLPRIPDVGVWRITSHSFYAGTELPGTVELLHRAYERGDVPAAKVAIELRTTKREGKTRHFPVIVLRLPWALADPERPAQLLRPVHPAELPGERAALPSEPGFRSDAHPGWGNRPSLPSNGGGMTPPTEGITEAQLKALHAASREADMDRTTRLSWATDVLERPVTSFNDLTRPEATRLLELLGDSVGNGSGQQGKDPAVEATAPGPGVDTGSQGEASTAGRPEKPSGPLTDQQRKALTTKYGSAVKAAKAANTKFGVAVVADLTFEQAEELLA